jgi:hypothetical protein
LFTAAAMAISVGLIQKTGNNLPLLNFYTFFLPSFMRDKGGQNAFLRHGFLLAIDWGYLGAFLSQKPCCGASTFFLAFLF